MKDFKIRASSCMDIMAESKVKGELSVGAKTYCKKWLKEYKFGRREEIKSKYISKGNQCEELGFDLVSTEIVKDMVYKNTENKSNEWLSGECDLFHKCIVYDNKSSWSLDTFPMFETEVPDKKYWWQMQCYGWLWGAEKLSLCYTLNDAPIDMVEREVKWVDEANERYKIAERMLFTQESFDKAMELLFPTATRTSFKPIPDEDRVREFKFDYETRIEGLIKQRVEMCREYIYSLLTIK